MSKIRVVRPNFIVFGHKKAAFLLFRGIFRLSFQSSFALIPDRLLELLPGRLLVLLPGRRESP